MQNKKYNKKLYVQTFEKIIFDKIWFKIQKSMIVFFGHLKYQNLRITPQLLCQMKMNWELFFANVQYFDIDINSKKNY